MNYPIIYCERRIHKRRMFGFPADKWRMTHWPASNTGERQLLGLTTLRKLKTWAPRQPFNPRDGPFFTLAPCLLDPLWSNNPVFWPCPFYHHLLANTRNIAPTQGDSQGDLPKTWLCPRFMYRRWVSLDAIHAAVIICNNTEDVALLPLVKRMPWGLQPKQLCKNFACATMDRDTEARRWRILIGFVIPGVSVHGRQILGHWLGVQMGWNVWYNIYLLVWWPESAITPSSLAQLPSHSCWLNSLFQHENVCV